MRLGKKANVLTIRPSVRLANVLTGPASQRFQQHTHGGISLWPPGFTGGSEARRDESAKLFSAVAQW